MKKVSWYPEQPAWTAPYIRKRAFYAPGQGGMWSSANTSLSPQPGTPAYGANPALVQQTAQGSSIVPWALGLGMLGLGAYAFRDQLRGAHRLFTGREQLMADQKTANDVTANWYDRVAAAGRLNNIRYDKGAMDVLRWIKPEAVKQLTDNAGQLDAAGNLYYQHRDKLDYFKGLEAKYKDNPMAMLQDTKAVNKVLAYLDDEQFTGSVDAIVPGNLKTVVDYIHNNKDAVTASLNTVSAYTDSDTGNDPNLRTAEGMKQLNTTINTAANVWNTVDNDTKNVMPADVSSTGDFIKNNQKQLDLLTKGKGFYGINNGNREAMSNAAADVIHNSYARDAQGNITGRLTTKVDSSIDKFRPYKVGMVGPNGKVIRTAATEAALNRDYARTMLDMLADKNVYEDVGILSNAGTKAVANLRNNHLTWYNSLPDYVKKHTNKLADMSALEGLGKGAKGLFLSGYYGK